MSRRPYSKVHETKAWVGVVKEHEETFVLMTDAPKIHPTILTKDRPFLGDALKGLVGKKVCVIGYGRGVAVVVAVDVVRVAEYGKQTKETADDDAGGAEARAEPDRDV